MTTLNTIIEEEKNEARRQVADTGTVDVGALLTTAMQRAYEAGREEERERIRKWATSNARTQDTNMSDFPENHEYTVDYHELTDFLSKQL